MRIRLNDSRVLLEPFPLSIAAVPISLRVVAFLALGHDVGGIVSVVTFLPHVSTHGSLFAASICSTCSWGSASHRLPDPLKVGTVLRVRSAVVDACKLWSVPPACHHFQWLQRPIVCIVSKTDSAHTAILSSSGNCRLMGCVAPHIDLHQCNILETATLGLVHAVGAYAASLVYHRLYEDCVPAVLAISCMLQATLI